MHVISKKAIETFCQKHSTARPALEAWYRIISKSHYDSFSALKQSFNSVDYAAPFTVFDVGGNTWRVIAVIHYNRQKIYIREVFTHAEYDQWNRVNRRKKS